MRAAKGSWRPSHIELPQYSKHTTSLCRETYLLSTAFTSLPNATFGLSVYYYNKERKVFSYTNFAIKSVKESLNSLKIENSSIDMSNNNFTKHWHLEDEQATSTGMVVLFLLCFILNVLVGCPIFISIVHFEHFGGDPQKRRLSNMILTNICIFAALNIIVIYLLLTLRIIFGPLYHMVVNIGLGAIIFTGGGLAISMMFGLFLRNLEMIKPQFALSLNDNFAYFCLTSVTILFDIVFTAFFCLKMHEIPYYYPFIGESSHIHFEISHINPSR